ncbi:hypothetical protein CBR_g45217 [Chara braunii]|uniref:Patatin n=1 Tax=Chara braunii TaxID=69332 RepID=A0A388K383_CHABU|nr:hypothetical protein CBR_g45217 [Chara braunii]|eukprot:GBG64521.1 hypothetical protein CBR_g45217 [Chara braunii]
MQATRVGGSPTPGRAVSRPALWSLSDRKSAATQRVDVVGRGGSDHVSVSYVATWLEQQLLPRSQRHAGESSSTYACRSFRLPPPISRLTVKKLGRSGGNGKHGGRGWNGGNCSLVPHSGTQGITGQLWTAERGVGEESSVREKERGIRREERAGAGRRGVYAWGVNRGTGIAAAARRACEQVINDIEKCKLPSSHFVSRADRLPVGAGAGTGRPASRIGSPPYPSLTPLRSVLPAFPRTQRTLIMNAYKLAFRSDTVKRRMRSVRGKTVVFSRTRFVVDGSLLDDDLYSSFNGRTPYPSSSSHPPIPSSPSSASFSTPPFLFSQPSPSSPSSSSSSSLPPPPPPPPPSSSSSSSSSSSLIAGSAPIITTKAKEEEEAIERPLLSFQGGGIFFYWQLGAARALSRHFDLDKADMAGASAGALAATLAACEVDAEEATKLAFQLSLDNRVWDRPTGLGGIWGPMIRSWLDELLPPNAAQLCDGRLHIYVLELPSLRRRSPAFVRRGVCQFHSKRDLIDACMASVHIPFFIDGGACARFRDRWCVDGSFLASKHSISPYPDRPTVWVDYMDDEDLASQRLRFLSLGAQGEGPQRTWQWLLTMISKGEAHVEKLLSDHKLAALDPIRKKM